MSSEAENDARNKSDKKQAEGLGERIAELFNRTWEMEVLLLFFLLGPLFLQAQREKPKYDREVHVDSMLQRMVAKDSGAFVIKDARIVGDPSGDKFDSLKVSVPVHIKDCHFEIKDYVYLGDIEFDSTVFLKKAKGVDMFFHKCVFNGKLKIYNSKIGNINIVSCNFYNGIYVNNIEGPYLSIRRSKVNLKNSGKKFDRKGPFEVIPKELGYLGVRSCTVRSRFGNSENNDLNLRDQVRFLVGEFDRMVLLGNSFNCDVYFSSATINKFLNLNKNYFDKNMFIGGFQPPPPHSMIFDFDQVKGYKLAVRTMSSLESGYDSIIPYKAKSNKQLTDTIAANASFYDQLLRAYNYIYKSSKIRGDRRSANACYIEKKHIETRKLRYEYEQDPTFRNFINYNLNRFLWVFARYGTSPTQAIVISFYIILLFGAFYFFTHTKWDRIDRDFLLDRIRLLNEYFRSEKRFKDLHQEKQGAADKGEPILKELEA
ncbi:MAG: hypothetical protein ABEH43_05760, partial [Flavobacteriales bacterium]